MAANVATVPASCSDPGIPVSINNVNCLNPYAPPGGLNCNCYRNNDLEDGGGAIDTEMDGLTETFFATTTINPGVNSIKIAIADAGDWVLDSNVFIKCESFVCGAPDPTGACCFGTDCVVTTEEACLASGGSYQGDDVLCSPNPCTSTPTIDSSWGRIKAQNR